MTVSQATPPSNWAIFQRQVRYQNQAFWRTPVAAFFSVMLPLLMMVLFNALFDGEVETDDGIIDLRTFYTAGLAAFAAVSSTYTNLANIIPIRRDEGVLKRWRGTPLSPALYLAGIITSAVIVAFIGVVLMMTLGVVLYGVELDIAKLPGAVLTFFVGVACFAALGMALAAVIPSAESAPAVANATILPLAFISGIFIPLEDAPRWLEILGDIFPLKHFVTAFQSSFNPLSDPPAIEWSSLGIMVLWGAAGVVLALKFFSWEAPVRSTKTRSSRRNRKS